MTELNTLRGEGVAYWGGIWYPDANTCLHLVGTEDHLSWKSSAPKTCHKCNAITHQNPCPDCSHEGTLVKCTWCKTIFTPKFKGARRTCSDHCQNAHYRDISRRSNRRLSRIRRTNLGPH